MLRDEHETGWKPVPLWRGQCFPALVEQESSCSSSSGDGAWGLRVGTPALHGGEAGKVGQVYNLSGGVLTASGMAAPSRRHAMPRYEDAVSCAHLENAPANRLNEACSTFAERIRRLQAAASLDAHDAPRRCWRPCSSPAVSRKKKQRPEPRRELA